MAATFLFVLFSAIYCYSGLGEAKIIRPCILTDYTCISDNLSAYSRCNPNVQGYIPSRYFVPTFHFETPYFNSSYIDKNLYVTNHDKCFVSEFFVNSNDGRIVLAFDCPQFDLESDRTYIQHKSLREDSLYHFHIRAIYPLIRITINFPPGNPDLCSASIFADVTTLPILKVNPQDKPTANQLTRDLTVLNIYERENFQPRGRAIAFIFVESLLCNFGCKLPV